MKLILVQASDFGRIEKQSCGARKPHDGGTAESVVSGACHLGLCEGGEACELEEDDNEEDAVHDQESLRGI